MIETEVVIIGCGPVGAFMANLLAARGIRTVVLEKDRAIYELPRAIAMDDEVMRILQSQGFEAAYTENATPIRGMDLLRGNRRRLRRISIETQHQTFGLPPGTFFHQPTLERHLRGAFAHYPGTLDVRLGVQVTQIRDGDPIELDLVETDTGKSETVRARYVLGCDGGRSFVRKRFGIEQEDLGLHQPWVVVDVTMKKPGPRSGYAEQICNPVQPATYIPAPSPRNRWEFMLKPGDDFQAATSPEFLAQRIRPWAAPEEYDIERAVVYTFHAVIAKSWRMGSRGTVFLLGDAAHQMPPFLGQGLCAGIRDAFNLAWKLDLVLHGRAGTALLDTFQSERQEHVRKVIVLAIRVGTIIQSRSYLKSFLVNTAMIAMERFGIGMPLSAVKDLPLGPGFYSRVHGPDKPGRCPFPQPRVVKAGGGTALRLDKFLGEAFTLLSRTHESGVVLANPLIRHLPIRRAGQSCAHDTANAILDSDGVLDAWLDQHQCDAVLLRPDRQPFGVYRGDAARYDSVEADLMQTLSSFNGQDSMQGVASSGNSYRAV